MKRRRKRADKPTDSGRKTESRLIVEQAEFEAVCDAAREAGIAAFDTEFVSDASYRPELCLLQLAVGEERLAVDPLVDGIDLAPWWDLVIDDETTIVAHGSQAEIRFCLDATDERPRRFVDVQVAAGLLGRGYPLSYTNLVSRVLNRRTKGKATRTDWSRRPLSDKQLEYALEDVEYLPDVWTKQSKSLRKRGRLDWAWAEFDRLIDDVAADREREPWTRLSGINKLNRRELGVLRELAEWRESEAERQDKLPRRVLRDDLLIDVARRHPSTREELLETRDMNRGNFRKAADDIIDAVRRGLEVPDDELPQKRRKGGGDFSEEEQVLGKLLAIALANHCAELDVATSLVGTASDLRDLVRWHVLDGDKGAPPALMKGWREEVCGDLLVDVLDGKIVMRVGDVRSDHPLVFERRGG